ncbi:transglycosylase family protein [Streptomyces lydicus]
MTGAGFALPLLAASGAHAADTATWDKVAQCETGGVWSAAPGNGYYGGLQLTQEMWDNYGGSAYASRPDLASRSQQIAVAESILDHRGPDVWSSCAVSAGLTKDGRAPEVDPGSVATPSPAPPGDGGSPDPWDSSGSPDSSGNPDASGSAGTHDRPGGEPSDPKSSPDAPGSAGTHEPGDGAPDPATPDDRADDPSQSADPSTDPSRSTDPSEDPSQPAGPSEGGSRTDTSGTPRETPAKGKHRGGAGEGSADGDGRSAGGRHASRGDAGRTGPAVDGDYTVRPGDTLSAIASAHRLSGGWSALYDRNEDVIGSDADLIKPGQLLDLGHSAG